MERKHNKKLLPLAKSLRKNMTKEERHLWYDFLKNYPIRFIRQKILGKYIADFYCAKANLVIELDGSQHYENNGKKYDKERTEYLKGYGITVVRISNIDIIRNFEGVCMYIDDMVKQSLSQQS
ncbi:MAG: endonuclease domain-containing protein [Clostridia bacterium]|nr:endonuclease domain-containing protein [Clostridia bacterium]